MISSRVIRFVPAVRTAALLASATALLPQSVDARRLQEPVLVQITHNTQGEVYEPRVRSEKADSVVFVSDGDVMGAGTAPGHREVYLYSLDDGSITQVTNTTDGESYGAARESDVTHSFRPALVPFISTGDLDVLADNSDHNPEVFLWTRETGEYIQITDTQPPVVNAEVYGSDSTRCIVWRSNGDLDTNVGQDSKHPGAGFKNPDGSDEIFQAFFGDNDLRAGFITQVSNGPAGTYSGKPVVGGFWYSRQCRSSAYESDHDQVGNGSSGLHIYNYTKTLAAIEQISPPGDGINRNPAMSSASNFARGPLVVFESNMNYIDRNATGSVEVFRFRLFRPELIQYTLDPVYQSEWPVVADGGGVLAFTSTAELLDPDKRIKGGGIPPFNADHNKEIYTTHMLRKIRQVTHTESCENTEPSTRDTGMAIAFRSTCDLIPGLNPNNVPQVFLYLDLAKRDEPLVTAEACVESAGCCNVANGCYQLVEGRKVKTISRAKIRPAYARN